MKTRHVLWFMGAVFFFMFLAQIGTRAFWSQEKGRLIWHEGQVLSGEDENVVTYIIRPKPTATPAQPAPTSSISETPTPTIGIAGDAAGTGAGSSSSQYSTSMLQASFDCLPAGTKIRMADATEKNIENVKVGEYVLSFDGKNKVHSKVLETVKTSRNLLFTLHFEDGTALQLTEEHPVYTKEGWKSISPKKTVFLTTLPLSVNDSVYTAEGNYLAISKITKRSETVQLYNLKNVENTNSYFANNVLVHNKAAAATDFTGSSFPVGTRVLMSDHTSKNIETISVGEKVITGNGASFGEAQVTAVRSSQRYDLCNITFQDAPTLNLNWEVPLLIHRQGSDVWKAIDNFDATDVLNQTVYALMKGDTVYYSSAGRNWRHYDVLDFNCNTDSMTITYNLILSGNDYTYFANGYLVHNKNAPAGGAGSSSSSSPVSSSSSSRAASSSSSSSITYCGTKVCTSTQTCFQGNCWLKCGSGGYCAGLYTCVSNACVPIVGAGSSSSLAYAPTVTPHPTSFLSGDAPQTNSSSSYSSRIYTSPVAPERPTNTPYPTRAPKNSTYFEPEDSAAPIIIIPSPTPIPSLLRGKTSTIVIEDEKSTTILKGEDVMAIKIAAPGGNKSGQAVSEKGTLLARKNSRQSDSQNKDNTSAPLLDLGLSLKQQGLANFGIQQEEIVLQKGKQVVTISAERNDTGMLAITQNNTTALTSMNMSINPTTNILTIETPYGPKRVSIMPDEALAIIRQLKVTDPGRKPEEVQILVRNNQLEYKIMASKLQKLLWLIPIVIPQEVYVSADSGGLMAVQKSPLYSFVSLFAF